jgi:hypothetical protein
MIPAWAGTLGWASDIAVLIFYASGRARAYAWANIGLCVPIALPALISGAYSTAALSFAFGFIAGTILWRGRRRTRPRALPSSRVRRI